MDRIRKIAWGIYGQYAWDGNQNNKVSESICDKIITVLKREKKFAGEKVLDAGCGTGYYASKICNAGFKVTAVDYADGMIKKARSKFDAKESLQFEKTDLSKVLPYKDSTFNHIVSISVLQTLPDPVFTLREFRRVLKPEGIIIATHTQKINTQKQLKTGSGKRKNTLSTILFYIKSYAERKGFSKYWTQQELKEIFIRSNFTIIQTEFVGSIFIMIAKGNKEQGIN